MTSAPDSMFDSIGFFGAHYDNIQLDTMVPGMEKHIDTLGLNDIQHEKKLDEMNSILIKSMLPATFGRILQVFGKNVLDGMINTVAKSTGVLRIYALVVWVMYVALLIRSCLINGRNTANNFGLVVLVGTVLNIFLVSLVIFCQSRYMIYNMALFYMALIVLIKDNVYCVKK